MKRSLSSGAASSGRGWSRNTEVKNGVSHPVRDFSPSPFFSALLLESLPKQTGFWARWSKLGITGTEAATAAGQTTNFGTWPETMWAEKRGYREREPMDEAGLARVTHGIEKEYIARALYEQLMGVEVTTHDNTITSAHGWLIHGCDGHASGHLVPNARYGEPQEYIVEIKCPARELYRRIYSNYMAQMQMGMAVHGVKWCDYVVYLERELPPAKEDGEDAEPQWERHIQVKRVHFNAETWRFMLDKMIYLMQCIEANSPPDRCMLATAEQASLLEQPFVRVDALFDQVVTPEFYDEAIAAYEARQTIL